MHHRTEIYSPTLSDIISTPTSVVSTVTMLITDEGKESCEWPLISVKLVQKLLVRKRHMVIVSSAQLPL
jgi:hypothetical protein